MPGFAAAALAAFLCGNAMAGVPEKPLMGLEAVQEQLPWFDVERNYPTFDGRFGGKRGRAVPAVTSIGHPRMEGPVSVRLSRRLYPAEDGHLDAVVRFDLPLHLDRFAAGRDPVRGELQVRLVDADGGTVSEQTVSPIPGKQLRFSYAFPEAMHGSAGELRVHWTGEGAPDAEASAAFEVAAPAAPARSGRIRLEVPNQSGASVARAPMSAGVPFPRGALRDTANLRLVDEAGAEVPLQVSETARWSRFGSVRWAMCSFAADLDGGPRAFYLEYGPDVGREERAPLAPVPGDRSFGELAFDAGRLRFGSEGLAYDFAGDGNYRAVLGPEALFGAFVEHVDATQSGHGNLTPGKRYAMSEAHRFEVEESGPEKLVLRAEGWFEHAESGDRFCKFVNRYVFHRDSPVVRVFHTWIFTGDGNDAGIRNMGWRFPLRGLEPQGFLRDFADGDVIAAGYLQQHDADAFTAYDITSRSPRVARRFPERLLAEPARPLREAESGARAPGVMVAGGEGGARVYVGVQDFWQNFPSSLKADGDALTFYQWPRYGRTRQNFLGPDDAGHAWRLPFAHEGEVLNFRLPDTLLTGPIYHAHSGPEPHWQYGRADTVNAQGIAKTAEMWLYLAHEEAAGPADAARVLEGLRDETLRAVVDPRWVAESRAMRAIAARDEEARPDSERAYEFMIEHVRRMVERMGVYGKWIYGDVLRDANLEARTAAPYRVFRKAHWGWPYSWLPYARSGDAQHLRFAQAATRMMSDVAYVHYVSDGMAEHFANLPARRMWDFKQPHRAKGWHNRNLVPWAGYWGPTTRCYVDQADFLWHAYYLTGYGRARDVALDWAEQTKTEAPFTVHEEQMGRGPITAANNRMRWPNNLLKQYVEMYEATWDPWFIEAAHAIAEMHLWRHREEGWDGGHEFFWNAGHQVYYDYSRCPEYAEFVAYAAYGRCDWHIAGWVRTASALIPPAIAGYQATGDEFFLRRLAGVVDYCTWATYLGEEPGHYRGLLAHEGANRHMIDASWYHLWYPEAVAVLEEAGMPEHPLPPGFSQSLGEETVIAVLKEPGEELLLRTRGRYSIIGPDGQTAEEGDERETVLAADKPAGLYRVRLGRRSVMVPITPPKNPEVMVLGEGEQVGPGARYVQHWFLVPEGVESFWVEFANPRPRQTVRQHAVWGPDGREAWAHREWSGDHDPDRETIRAEIQVPPGQAGRLWRVTVPGVQSVPFRLDPALPQILAHDPGRWFDPGERLPGKPLP